MDEAEDEEMLEEHITAVSENRTRARDSSNAGIAARKATKKANAESRRRPTRLGPRGSKNER
jgi:hypothetical protein